MIFISKTMRVVDMSLDLCLSRRDVRAVGHVSCCKTGDDSQGQLPLTASTQWDDSYWFSLTRLHIHLLILYTHTIHTHTHIYIYGFSVVYTHSNFPQHSVSLFFRLSCVNVVLPLSLGTCCFCHPSVTLFIFCSFLHPVSPFSSLIWEYKEVMFLTHLSSSTLSFLCVCHSDTCLLQ